jgi:hypothetical protein
MFAAHVALMQPLKVGLDSLDAVLRLLLCLLQKATKKNGIEPADYSDPKTLFH